MAQRIIDLQEAGVGPGGVTRFASKAAQPKWRDKAAELYYQIQRYDQAIEFLLKANQLQPTDYRTVAILGMVNLDAGHFETAEKWYRAALKMKEDDTMVLAGLTEATLQRGDAKAAEDAIAKLEKVDPSSQDLPRFRDKLASLKSGK